MDNIDKIINSTKVLRESLTKLIEVFTMYYGEDNREYIEKKFNDVMMLSFHKNEEMLEYFETQYSNMKEEKAKQIIEETLYQYDYPSISELVGWNQLYSFTMNFSNISFVELKTHIEEVKLAKKYTEISKYVPNLDYTSFFERKFSEELVPEELYKETKELLDSYNKFPKRKNDRNLCVWCASRFMDEVDNDNIDDMIREGKLDKVYQVCKTIIKKKEEEYDPFCDSLSSFQNVISYFEKEELVRKKIQYKHHIDFLKEFKYLLSKRDQEYLELSDRMEIDTEDMFDLNNVLPKDFSSSLQIEYFRKEYDDKLNDPDTPSFLKDTIKDARLDYFRYGDAFWADSYEELVEDSYAQERWPSEELIDKIKDSYLEHKKKYEEEVFDYYLGYSCYKDALVEAEKIGLLNKEGLYTPAFWMQNIFKGCVLPNVVKDGDGYKLFSQLSIGVSDFDFLDETIIHEFNHIYETDLISCDGKSYTYSCGWDGGNDLISHDIIKGFDENSEGGKYTYFNEIVNEFIAQQITALMHEKGVYIFSDPKTAKEKGGSGYECTAFIAKDFFDEYYDTIIASRRDNNMQLIVDKVGEENFEELNSLFKEYHELFPGVYSFYLHTDLEDGKDTALTRKYNLLVEKRDKILDNMREYSKDHSTKID